ncbi:MAG: DUF3489 domain-containing protein [Novosphingobium sp.]
MTTGTETKPATMRARKMARQPSSETACQALLARQSKTDHVLDLLRRPDGATLEQLVAATGWLPHTTRAAMTGLKKKGHPLVSEKTDGIRRYRIEAGAA